MCIGTWRLALTYTYVAENIRSKKVHLISYFLQIKTRLCEIKTENTQGQFSDGAEE